MDVNRQSTPGFATEAVAPASHPTPGARRSSKSQYAGEIFLALAPAPYRDVDARVYARLMLIPRELLEWPRPAALADPVRIAHGWAPPEEPLVELGCVLRAQRRRAALAGRRCERRAR